MAGAGAVAVAGGPGRGPLAVPDGRARGLRRPVGQRDLLLTRTPLLGVAGVVTLALLGVLVAITSSHSAWNETWPRSPLPGRLRFTLFKPGPRRHSRYGLPPS